MLKEHISRWGWFLIGILLGLSLLWQGYDLKKTCKCQEESTR